MSQQFQLFAVNAFRLITHEVNILLNYDFAPFFIKKSEYEKKFWNFSKQSGMWLRKKKNT